MTIGNKGGCQAFMEIQEIFSVFFLLLSSTGYDA